MMLTELLWRIAPYALLVIGAAGIFLNFYTSKG